MKALRKKALMFSIAAVMILTAVVPDLNPVQLNSETYKYSYGLPFNYYNVYADNDTNWLFPKLFTGNAGVHIDLLRALLNTLIYYLVISFVLRRMPNHKRGLI